MPTITLAGRAPTPFPARTLTAIALAVTLLTSCAGPDSRAATSSSTDVATTTHGVVDGARELSEPELSLVLADGAGRLTLVDLLDRSGTALPGGRSPVDAMAGDGRFVYLSHASGDRTTVEIVDSGRWTVEHGDHFHYYRATERAVGTVTGIGPATVHSGDRRTAVAFPASGEVVVLTQDDLAAGTLGTPRTVTRRPHRGLLAVPFAGHLLVTAPDQTGTAASVELLDGQGRPVGEARTPCPDASDAAMSRVGAVVACSDGAVLVTATDGPPGIEKITYPAGVAPPARSLSGRAGRPALAGVPDPADGTGPVGFWQLDTRRRVWTFRPTDRRLVTVSAAGDDAGRTVAVDDGGRLRVFGPDGGELGTTEPRLAASLADPVIRDRVRLVLDANRAYASGPAEGVVLEVDYRDGGRIARTFDGLDPQFFEQVG